MTASLPMYDRAELVDAHDAFWQLIKGYLLQKNIPAPEHLCRESGDAVWLNPDLVLSQTCGMPFRLQLKDRVSLIGTPDFALPGCEPGYYRSVFVIHAQSKVCSLANLMDATFAFNNRMSQSGFSSPYTHLRSYGYWFNSCVETGSHRDSAITVQAGRADIACLDAVSWRLMQRYDAFTADLKVLEYTQPTPGLPYISRPNEDVDIYFSAIKQAIEALNPTHRELLGIHSLVRIPQSRYLDVPNPPSRIMSASAASP